MAEQQHGRTNIWRLSGILAVLGMCIAIFAAMEQLTVTLVVVGVAVVVTGMLGTVLAKTDR